MEAQSESRPSIQEFQYASSGLPAPFTWQNIVSLNSESGSAAVPGSQAPVSANPCTTESARALEERREQGIEEGRRIERLEQEARMKVLEEQRIEQAEKLNEHFALEHEKFLKTIEPEVVKLALSIAERILRREAQVDPLSLTNAVRVALGQLADKTAVRVRVPAKDALLWKETLERLPNLRTQPTIMADEKLEPGECQLESECGIADLSIQSQLREISRDMLDNASVDPNEIVNVHDVKRS